MGESELGKMSSDLAQKTMDRVSEHAEELRKTDVGQAVQKVSKLFSLCPCLMLHLHCRELAQ